jgi:hypothetical protein
MKRIIHLAQRPRRSYAAFLAAVAIPSFLLSSCAGTATQRYYSEPSRAAAGAEYRAAQLKRDSARAVGHGSDMAVSDVQPPFLIAPPPKPGLFSGVGKLFSTPEGVARRQAVKLAKAAVPRSIGKGAVYALNSKVANGFKSDAPVTAADSNASVNNAAANSQQQNVKGNDNNLSAKQANPTQEAPGPLAVLADNATKWIPYAAIGGGALLLLWLWRKKKQAAA